MTFTKAQNDLLCVMAGISPRYEFANRRRLKVYPDLMTAGGNNALWNALERLGFTVTVGTDERGAWAIVNSYGRKYTPSYSTNRAKALVLAACKNLGVILK